MLKKVVLHSVATALASMVFPVPVCEGEGESPLEAIWEPLLIWEWEFVWKFKWKLVLENKINRKCCLG